MKHHTRKDRQARNASIKEASRLRAERQHAWRTTAIKREQTLANVLCGRSDPVSRFFQENPAMKDYAQRTPRFEELCKALQKKAPRLLDESYVDAFIRMTRIQWLRPLVNWTPKGKGKSSLFRSLAQHLFALYPTPDMVWSMFFHPDAERLQETLAGVAAGQSLFHLASRHLPLALTKKQCHRILTSRGSFDFVMAARVAQFADLGTNRRLLLVWLGSDIGQRLHEKNEEEFYLSFVRLCAQTVNFDANTFDPILDYLVHRRGEHPAFSLKGRTVPSLIRSMEEWHAELRQQRSFLNRFKGPLPRSGFPGAFYRSTANKRGAAPTHQAWRIQEIVSAEDLFQEGRSQKHCVYSYGHSILRGTTSIWSLTLNQGHGAGPERAVTVELRNAEKKVVQIRGFANRRVRSSELRVIVRWASENGLQVSANA